MPDAKFELQAPQRPQSRKTSEDSSKETFETPPTSPVRTTGKARGPLPSNSVSGEAFVLQKPSLSPQNSTKRPRTEQTNSVHPRKVSRESLEHHSAKNPAQPGNAESSTGHTRVTVPNLAAAISTVEDREYQQTPLISSRSFENLGSMSSSIAPSFNSIASAFTSPHTSFTRNSSKTSFESSTDNTDTAVRTFQERAVNQSFNFFLNAVLKQ